MSVYPARPVSSDDNIETSVILVVAAVLTAECREFWQLILCQGILTGFACGMIFGSIPAIVSQWFEKRRSLAFGLVAAGSALGGTIIPIAARNLIELIGYASKLHERRTRLMGFSRFKWTMRVVALIELFVLAIANLVRVPMPYFNRHSLNGVAFRL